MQVTIDIPETAYFELEKEARREQTTTENIAASRLLSTIKPGQSARQKHRIEVPLIRSQQPGTFDPGEGGVYDYIEFP